MTWHAIVIRPRSLTVHSDTGEHIPRALLFLDAHFINFPNWPTLPLIEFLNSQSSNSIYFLSAHSFTFITTHNPLHPLHLLVLSASFVMASRLALVLCMCVLPAMVVAIRPAKNPFCVKGRVLCDPCRAGFETSAITNIAGNY